MNASEDSQEDFPSSSLPEYGKAYADFDLAALGEVIGASRDGGLDWRLNACVECCDRHAGDDRTALEWEDEAGHRLSLTFAELRDRSARFAGVLASRGIVAGDVVGGLLPRIPELIVTILGTWRAGAVYQPFFTAFGPKAIEHRLDASGARLVVTTPGQRHKLNDMAHQPTVMVIGGDGGGGGGDQAVGPDDLDYAAELARQPSTFEPVMRASDDPMMLLFTSGTTGLPKGVPVPLKALLAFRVYMTDAVDLRPADRFWNIADPGWAYGLYYAVTGPLLLGHATTLYDGPFNAESTYRIIETHGITSLAGSPTAFRMLMAAGPEPAARVKGRLRVVSSAGEPLNPEVIRWFATHLDVVIHDHYGQTELGMVVNNHHGLAHPVHAGSAGFPMRGHRVVVLDPDGRELAANEPGELAIDIARSPLMWFSGYLEQKTPAIAHGYYRTGDTVERAPEGHFSFVGRNDDVITSSGYRIGPFDVESALLEHPAVIEAAVVGKPDPERTEIVQAFVVVGDGVVADDALAEALRQHVRRRLSAHAYPREVVFIDQLPKTPSGKIQRFLLRQHGKTAP